MGKSTLFDAMPSWKKQRVLGESDARSFFEREAAARDVPAGPDTLMWQVTSFNENGDGKFQIAVFLPQKLSPTFYAGGYFSSGNGELTIEIFIVSTTPFGQPDHGNMHRGKGLSLVGMKTLIGIAAERLPVFNTIRLEKVSDDGPRFWASLDGYPEHGLSARSTPYEPSLYKELCSGIDEFEEARADSQTEAGRIANKLAGTAPTDRHDSYALQRAEVFERLKGSERYRQVLECRDMAKQYPALAYRRLAGIKRSGEKYGDEIDHICAGIFGTMRATSNDDIMVINLKDPGTLDILHEKLGALPLCPAPISFSAASMEIAKRSGDGRFLARAKRSKDMLQKRCRDLDSLDY